MKINLMSSSVSRRALFRYAAAVAGGVVATLSAIAPSYAKMTQKAAGYQNSPEKRPEVFRLLAVQSARCLQLRGRRDQSRWLVPLLREEVLTLGWLQKQIGIPILACLLLVQHPDLKAGTWRQRGGGTRNADQPEITMVMIDGDAAARTSICRQLSCGVRLAVALPETVMMALVSHAG